jgi:transposase-like protein
MPAEVPIAVAQAAIARALGAGQTKAGLARLIGRNSSLITQWQRGTKSLGGGRTQTFRGIDRQTVDSLTRAADLAEARETVQGAAARPRRSGAGGRISGVRRGTTTPGVLRGKRQAVASGSTAATKRIRDAERLAQARGKPAGLALTVTMLPGTRPPLGAYPVAPNRATAVTKGVVFEISPGQAVGIRYAVLGGQDLTTAVVEYLTAAGVVPPEGRTIRESIVSLETRTWPVPHPKDPRRE